MSIPFLRWWFIIVLSVFGLIATGSYGLLSKLWVVDITKISFIILFIYICISLFIGYMTYVCDNPNTSTEKINDMRGYLPAGWFSSAAMAELGMVGTVIGFMIMLGPAFANINIADPTSTQQTLASMAIGMGTALTTTLVGLVCSLLTKMQLVNLEHTIDPTDTLEDIEDE